MNTTSAVFFDTADVARSLLDRGDLEARWNDQSPLRAMTMGELTAHLCRAVVVVDTYLDTHGTADPVDAPGYFLGVEGILAPDLDDPTAVGVRTRAAESAARGLASVRSDWDRARRSLARRLLSEDGARLIGVFSSTMTIDEYLVTRLVELIVHADDLATGLETTTPQFSDTALALVQDCLWAIARRRSEPLKLIRSMTRTERESREPFRVF